MLILSYGEGIVVCFLFHMCVVISLFFINIVRDLSLNSVFLSF
jgi:hypothetical protein